VSPKSSQSLVLAVRDALAVFGSLYMGLTTYEHVAQVEVIRPTGGDYVMFGVVVMVAFAVRQLRSGYFRRSREANDEPQ
jgi:hypothetical protein